MKRRRLGEWPKYPNNAVRLREEMDWGNSPRRGYWDDYDDEDDYVNEILPDPADESDEDYDEYEAYVREKEYGPLMRSDQLRPPRHYPGMWPFELAIANNHFKQYIKDAFKNPPHQTNHR